MNTGRSGAFPGAARRPAERARWPGVRIAAVTAMVSGVAVFVNSYGVKAVPDAAVYTTSKNLVAAVLLCAVAGIASGVRHRRVGNGPGARPLGAPRPGWHLQPAQWLGLAYVGVVGGGIAFVLFFEGLAHTTAEPAAFLHDTLVIWVALLAVPSLRERLSTWNVAAILLLVGGQVVVTGGMGHLVAGGGQALVLAATVLWAVETVVAKVILRSVTPAALAVVRMGVGVAVLTAFVLATGRGGALIHLGASQAGWALVTGSLLAAYVGTWMMALSRARAVDVTSVLVFSVVVTFMLQLAAGHPGSAADAVGLMLVAAGTAAAVTGWRRLRPATPGAEELALPGAGTS
jgi:drug/metabolite transporter (DMT)-like permease